jgi:peptidoglycan/LPS O-acetylase OafA/YrhL
MSDDVYSGKGIEWRWVLVGMLIVLGLQSLLAAALGAAGIDLSRFIWSFFTVTVAFSVGGVLIGWMSPGYTPWEAGFASLLAAAATILLTVRLFTETQGLEVLIPLAGFWGLACGLAGGKLGERIQGTEAP